MLSDQVRVFLSCHRSPREDVFAGQLASALDAAGADVWFEPAPAAPAPSPALPFGVDDMAGVIYEWTSSLFRAYPYVPRDG